MLRVAKKTTKIEKAFREDTVYKLLSEGQSRMQVLQFCSDQWGVSERTGEHYLAAAREKLLKDADMARPAWLAEALARARTYEQAAYRRGQNQVAINSLQLQAKLIGLEA